MRCFALCVVMFFAGSDFAWAEERPFVLQPNMDVLKCKLPDEQIRFVGSNAPGQLFFAEESVDLRLAVKKGVPGGEWKFELQEITTRDPDAKIKESFTDTSGHAPLIGLAGQPVTAAFSVKVGDEAETAVEIKNLPVPKKFGTYAILLVRGDDRRFLATVARLPKPRADATLDNTPIFGEFALFDHEPLYETRAAMYERMGIRGMRLETSWSEREDGTVDWNRTDKIFAAAEKHGIQLMVTLGGHPGWTWPFGPHMQTPAAVRPGWDGNPYWGQADWLTDPKLYPRYGKWITEFCRRYWKDGRGALWGLENYNEPWEGGGISGWARDAVQYREIQKLIAESAWKVDRRIKICAASSIMNTEDKFFADGSRTFDRYLDVFTDHYVVPCMSYGPLVARAHGKESVETETWFVGSEYLTPQIVQFLAAGQRRLSPWHPRVLFDRLPGTNDHYLIPTPAVAASAAFNHFLAGRPFERIVFHDHLPWVFQFGKDADRDGLLVVFGQLISIGGTEAKERLWAQVEGSAGGTITIDNADGLLKFYDLAGNPQYVGQPKIELPLSIFPAYIASDKGPAAAAERIRAAVIRGKRPVEIIPRDFTTRVDARGAELRVMLHNCLNREITGTLVVTSVGFRSAKAIYFAERKTTLPAGGRETLVFPLVSAQPNAANAYPFAFRFESDAGNVDYAETLNCTIAPRGSKTIDGNLDDWKDVPPINVAAGFQAAELTELLRRPWLDLKDQKPDGNFAEFKVAWDDQNLYFAARVNDKTPQPESPAFSTRDENAYFHTADSDKNSPFDDFLKKHPGKSFAAASFVYRDSPERPRDKSLPWIPFRRDRLHIALDVTDDWHDLAPTTDRVPLGFHAVPDTDYEFSLHACSGGTSELYRLLAPGLPRKHDFPRCGRAADPTRDTGAVASAKHVVRREGSTYVYELAIPKSELKTLVLRPGSTFGMTLRAGNNDGPHVDFGLNKAATKINGLTLHPYWERSVDCGVRWALVE